MKKFLWVLAFTFISTSTFGDSAPASPARVAAQTVEGLRSSRSAYLVVDINSRELRIVVGRVDVDRVSLVDVRASEMVEWDGPRRKLVLPQVWTVKARTPAPNQRVVSPDTKLAKSGPVAELLPPPAYDVVTSDGWVLAIGYVAKPESPPSRLWRLVKSGLANLSGGGTPASAPRIELGMTATDAERIHHLFRPGTSVVINP